MKLLVSMNAFRIFPLTENKLVVHMIRVSGTSTKLVFLW